MKVDAPNVMTTISTADERRALLAEMVLSVSGWRLRFGSDPESLDPTITPVQRDLVAFAARSFARYLKHATGVTTPVVVLGTDTRPTGPAIADTVMRVFLIEGFTVEWLGPVASPEIMAYTKVSAHLDGFYYVTASHNPPGYNGFKFGRADGAVLSGEDARGLIETYRNEVPDQNTISELVKRLATIAPALLSDLETNRPAWKRNAGYAYQDFLLRLAAGEREDPDSSFVIPVRKRLAENPLGIVGELNGSARCTSVDRTILPYLGVRVAFHNDRAGTFAHQILPEGDGLRPAADLLREYHRQDESFTIAYVPDNDGDRGNVILTDHDGGTISLEAQAVFALSVLIELAWMKFVGHGGERICVVANGPTSGRIDEIARWFGAEVFRAEVGEANVVSLAELKRNEGWIVPILGEGSNGGNIKPPATVRDPMSTILALLKLHAFPLAELVRSVREGRTPPSSNGGDSPAELLQLMPAYTTIETDDPRAKMHIGSVPHETLKRRYEKILPHRITPMMEDLGRDLGVTDWELWNFEGTRSVRGPGNRQEPGTGGLKVVFLDSHQRPRASVWMRGSGTEPVFRVLADCAGDNPGLVDRLIEWQRRCIQEALQ